MKLTRFEVIWILITAIVAGTAYYNYGNASAREIFDIQCTDLYSALIDDCPNQSKIDALLNDMEPTNTNKGKIR